MVPGVVGGLGGALADPLAGMALPPGSPGTLYANAATYSAISGMLQASSARQTQAMSAVGPAWLGDGSISCQAAVGHLADSGRKLGTAAEGAVTALKNCGAGWEAAIGKWQQAQTLAAQAVADETAQRNKVNQMAAAGNPIGVIDQALNGFGINYQSPARSQATALGRAAIDDFNQATQRAGSALTAVGLTPPPPKPAHHGGGLFHDILNQVEAVPGGLYQGTVPGIITLVKASAPIFFGPKPQQDLLKALLHDVTHPVDLAKNLVDYQDFANGNIGRGIGELAPSIALGFLTDGASSGASAAARSDAVLNDAGITAAQRARAAATPEFGNMLNGNVLNAARADAFPYNELYVLSGTKSPYSRLDAYVPDSVIVSRKATQLSSVSPGTAKGYLQELINKYQPGTPIASTPSVPAELKGQPLSGQMVLEVPTQTAPIPQSVLDTAKQLHIQITQVPFKAPLPVPPVRPMPQRVLIGTGAGAANRVVNGGP